MRRRALALSIAAAVLPLTACTPSLHDIEVGHLMGESGKTLTAEFSDAGRLPLGAEVRFGAQVVGRVTDIEVHDFQAVVELSITDDTAVPEGTTARIELTSALGEEYVMLHPPAEPGPPLPDGARLENTSKGPDVEDALAALGAVVNGAGMDQARTVISEFNNAFDGRDQQLRELLEQLRSGLAALEAQSDQITEVIDDVHALSERLAAGKPTIERALTSTPPLLEMLLAERDRFTALLGNTSRLAGAADQLADQLDSSVRTQVRQLRPALAELRSTTEDLEATLSNLQRFSALFQRATPGDYVLFNGTVDVPGMIVQLLAPGTPMPPPGENPLEQLLGQP
ncbi:MCE family protein [Saccharopolyspora rectivirgula]|jgi:phospholipid/cholesterol/gamma-HCH transport system substrate-binding protein|uniref:MCE family protein n=1 Tax=Saccharopolyspora rectivirgula TaxID=28042 RepID=UPI0024096072|nr:MlaD family protein [Saccharopolyspora rectivirgula]